MLKKAAEQAGWPQGTEIVLLPKMQLKASHPGGFVHRDIKTTNNEFEYVVPSFS